METTTKSFERECQKHMSNQGITSKEKLQHQLQQIFEQAEHQQAALIGLYKMIFPNWERIERLEGHPVVGRHMWRYIANLFIDFDQRHHPKVFKGGLWVSTGFSSSNELGPWEISFDRCRVIYT
ncbi:MAG: hypothetical protein HUN04_04470 [Desulfobacter sp.]|nr:MAG: hypothetical protein HUN04_04470 [Desulfobacter sp.]